MQLNGLSNDLHLKTILHAMRSVAISASLLVSCAFSNIFFNGYSEYTRMSLPWKYGSRPINACTSAKTIFSYFEYLVSGPVSFLLMNDIDFVFLFYDKTTLTTNSYAVGYTPIVCLANGLTRLEVVSSIPWCSGIPFLTLWSMPMILWAYGRRG